MEQQAPASCRRTRRTARTPRGCLCPPPPLRCWRLLSCLPQRPAAEGQIHSELAGCSCYCQAIQYCVSSHNNMCIHILLTHHLSDRMLVHYIDEAMSTWRKASWLLQAASAPSASQHQHAKLSAYPHTLSTLIKNFSRAHLPMAAAPRRGSGRRPGCHRRAWVRPRRSSRRRLGSWRCRCRPARNGGDGRGCGAPAAARACRGGAAAPAEHAAQRSRRRRRSRGRCEQNIHQGEASQTFGRLLLTLEAPPWSEHPFRTWFRHLR